MNSSISRSTAAVLTASIFALCICTVKGSANISSAKETDSINKIYTATKEEYPTEKDLLINDRVPLVEDMSDDGTVSDENTFDDRILFDDTKATASLKKSFTDNMLIEPASMYKTLYVDWERHYWTASYNGSNIILSFDIDFYAIGGGADSFAPKYTFGFSKTSSNPSNVLECTNANNASKVSSRVGSVNVTSFTRTGGDTPYSRHLILKGYVTVDAGRVSSFATGRFRYLAGGWKDGDWSAADNNDFNVTNFWSVYKQASCGHPSWSYSQNGAGGHIAKCNNCGFSKQLGHNIVDGTCSLCGYKSLVKVMLNYELNNRTLSEELELAPGLAYQPKMIKGYKKPEPVTIPNDGGSISIIYEPITYTISDDEDEYLLKYDDSLFLPLKERKGYIHKGYRVIQVS